MSLDSHTTSCGGKIVDTLLDHWMAVKFLINEKKIIMASVYKIMHDIMRVSKVTASGSLDC